MGRTVQINGQPVIEAKLPVTLNVTDKDVKQASRKNPGMCAAARCCLRQPKVTDVRVHASRTYLKIGKHWFRYQTSGPLRQEIISFDRGGTFSPGVYELKPLPDGQKAIGRRQGSNVAGARDKGSKDRTPKKPRRPYRHVQGIRSSFAVSA